ncbi:hypothetical protein LOTGIDRAFT_156440 [Lottia gigantea]|uniref:G-protein coupled receptors family 1 profile domain-containing protein n=1 Tax=Lottia gigantea TaxID=225164 RepID=V4B0S4_LOTGI|nr:hypothetical protein LOTGIDRAFT_156440 [Lottia gigantea]ESP03843.1 hypothetical protein LOTGIDRAFT_156440 [Lottia gigantea]
MEECQTIVCGARCAVRGAGGAMCGAGLKLGNKISEHTRIKSLSTTSNMLILNLCVGCLIMCIVDFPLYATSSFLQKWIFGHKICEIYATITGTAGLLIMNSYSAIAFDRFITVTRYNNPNYPRSKSATMCISGFVWIYSLSWSMAPVVGWSRYQLDGSGTTCTFDYLSTTWTNRSFILSIAFFNFVLPLCFILFAYSRILHLISSHSREMKSYRSAVIISKGKASIPKRFRSERKTAITLLITVVVFCLSWVPYVIIALIGQFGNQSFITPQISVIPQLVAKLSTVTNPILYSLSHPVVRNKLFLRLRHELYRRPSDSVSSSRGIQMKNIEFI